jgi:flagellar protein FliT
MQPMRQTMTTTATPPVAATGTTSPATPQTALLQYYEAIERASREMLQAARDGDWDRVVKLEGACAVLISQLKHAATGAALAGEEAQMKARIMQRILLNDAEIRYLAEPWLEDIDQMLSGQPRQVMH